MSKHTPGPWEARDNYVMAEGYQVCCCWKNTEHLGAAEALVELRANVHLLAAAPDLLEACRQLVFEFPFSPMDLPHGVEAMDFARAAIAKAGGGE